MRHKGHVCMSVWKAVTKLTSADNTASNAAWTMILLLITFSFFGIEGFWKGHWIAVMWHQQACLADLMRLCHIANPCCRSDRATCKADTSSSLHYWTKHNHACLWHPDLGLGSHRAGLQGCGPHNLRAACKTIFWCSRPHCSCHRTKGLPFGYRSFSWNFSQRHMRSALSMLAWIVEMQRWSCLALHRGYSMEAFHSKSITSYWVQGVSVALMLLTFSCSQASVVCLPNFAPLVAHFTQSRGLE